MQIPSYQIQNVLKAFSRQLSQGRIRIDPEQTDPNRSAPPIRISAEGKKATIFEKVASGIVEKIKTIGTSPPMTKEIVSPMDTIYKEKKNHFRSKRRDRFIFNVIDENNNKTTRILSVEGSTFVIENMGSSSGRTTDNAIH